MHRFHLVRWLISLISQIILPPQLIGENRMNMARGLFENYRLKASLTGLTEMIRISTIKQAT